MDKTLRVWDLADGRLVGKAMPMKTSLDHLAFSPDSEQLLTLTCEKHLAVWHLCQGERPCMSCEPGQNIEHGHWDADGLRMLTINEAGAAQIMNLRTGMVVTPPLAHGGPLHSVAVQGRTIITVASAAPFPSGNSPMATSIAKTLLRCRLIRVRWRNYCVFVQVLAGGRIDDQQQCEAFDPAQLRSAWENWQNTR